MSLKLAIECKEVEIDRRKFPAGETFIRIPAATTEATTVAIQMQFEGDDDIIALALLVDAVRREYGKVRIMLDMPYLPYARQDRVCADGESLSVKVVADIINSMEFDAVLCKDIHSSVGVALLNNCINDDLTVVASPLNEIFARVPTVLVSPDAGANKKVLDFAKAYSFPNVVRADKTRDVLTGAITGTAVYSGHVGNKDFLILDDICDGGRTFIELAKELRKLTDGKVYLYVTHGIFSAGMDVFDGLIDKIYVANLMNTGVKDHPLIQIL